MSRAQKGSLHSSFDCVWGFTQIGVTKETSKLLALVTRRGLLLPKVLYFGPKQGPGIFQAFADSVFGNLRGPEKEEFLSIFVDDCNVSTQGYGNETDNDIFDRHLRQLEIFFKAAQQRNVQFKFDKSKLGCCLLYTSPSPRDRTRSRMPSSA